MKLKRASFILSKKLKGVAFDFIGYPYYNHTGAVTNRGMDLLIRQNFAIGAPFERTYKPSHEFAKMWFAVKHKIHVTVLIEKEEKYKCRIQRFSDNTDIIIFSTTGPDNQLMYLSTYDAAMHEGLMKACEILEEDNI